MFILFAYKIYFFINIIIVISRVNLIFFSTKELKVSSGSFKTNPSLYFSNGLYPKWFRLPLNYLNSYLGIQMNHFQLSKDEKFYYYLLIL